MGQPIGAMSSVSPVSGGFIRKQKAPFPRRVIITGDSRTSKGNYNTAPSAVASVADVVTVTDSNHGLFVGASFTMANADQEAFNGIFRVATVPDSSTFTYSAPGSGTQTATGYMQVINNQGLRDTNWLEIANVMLGHPFTVWKNAGKPGKGIAYIAAAFQRDVLSFNPDMVQIQGGINDITAIKGAPGTGATVLQTLIDNYRSMISRCVNAGIIPLVLTINPVNVAYQPSGSVGHTAEGMQTLFNFNSWLHEEAKEEFPQMILFDSWQIVVNPLNTDGDMASNMTSDDIHESSAATQAMGIALATLLGNIYYPQARRSGSVIDAYASSSNNKNIILNPLFVTTGGSLGVAGAGSGSATNTAHPTLWTGTWTRSGLGTVTSTVVARSDGFGNDLIYTCTPANASDQISVLTNAMASRASAGDILQAGCNLQISAIDKVSNVFFAIDWAANSITATQPCGMQTGSTIGLSTAFNWDLETNPFEVPASLTALRIRLTIAFSAAATNVVVKFGRVWLRKKQSLIYML